MIWDFRKLSDLSAKLSRNIKELRHAEKSHYYAGHKLYDSVLATADWVWEVDKDGVYIYVGPNAIEFAGYEPELLLGKSMFEFMPPAEADKFRKIFLDKIEEKEPVLRIEHEYLNKNGHLVILETNAIPNLSGEGKCVGFRGLSRDITALKLAEEELKSHQEIVKSMVKNSAVATFVIDANHNVLYWNKACEQLTGTRAADLIDTDNHWKAFYDHKRQCVADIIIDGNVTDMKMLYAICAQSELIEGGLHSEGWYPKLGGKDRYIIFDAAPIKDNKGNIVAAVETLHDITESKLAEEELRKAYYQLQLYQSQLIKAEKMEIVGRLASGVAHEVKNPLAVILQGVEYLARHSAVEGNAEVRVVLNYITEAVKRADNIIKGMLDFSSVSEIRIEQVDLNTMAEHALLLVNNAIERKHILVNRPSGRDAPFIKGDRNKIEQVFINLFMNAIEAMPAGGELTVKIRSAESPDELAFGDRAAVVEIADSGPGIPNEILNKIFDPFFTTKRDSGGTGLGLSIVRNIIEMHNGRIMVENKEGQNGACVRMIFKS